MKRSVSISVLLVMGATLLFAQAIDKPLANVRLTRTQVITQRQLKRVVDAFEAAYKITLTKDQRIDRLNELINRALIEQAAERDKVSVADNDVAKRLTDLEALYGQQVGAGRALTEVELQGLIKQQGGNWDDFVKDQKYVMLATTYARQKNKAAFDAIKQTTDDEARTYYDANKTKFVISDMVHIKWIVVDTRALTTKDERDKAAKRADDILKELKGGAKFDDLVGKYSDDTFTKYKGGDYGWVYRNNAQAQQYVGDTFMNSVFSMKKGDTSGVIPMNVGFAIVQVVDKVDAKILGLDEVIPGQQAQGTVKDAIKLSLYNQKASDTLAKVLQELADSLRKQAEVKIFEENLVW